MNQKNIFSVISVVLILQGVAFYFMKDQMVTDTFPGLDAAGYLALTKLMEVVCALSILLGLVTYANRNTPGVVWAFTLGTLVLVLVTSKHMFMDKVNVPLAAFIIQLLILLSCAYLWSKQKPA